VRSRKPGNREAVAPSSPTLSRSDYVGETQKEIVTTLKGLRRF